MSKDKIGFPIRLKYESFTKHLYYLTKMDWTLDEGRLTKDVPDQAILIATDSKIYMRFYFRKSDDFADELQYALNNKPLAGKPIRVVRNEEIIYDYGGANVSAFGLAWHKMTSATEISRLYRWGELEYVTGQFRTAKITIKEEPRQ